MKWRTRDSGIKNKTYGVLARLDVVKNESPEAGSFEAGHCLRHLLALQPKSTGIDICMEKS